MKEQNKLEIYNSMPVSQAVVRNAIPAMAAMLMTLIYNLADTFFIGQTHNACRRIACKPRLSNIHVCRHDFWYRRNICYFKGYGRGTERPCKKNIFFLYVVMCRCRNYYVLPVVTLYG